MNTGQRFLLVASIVGMLCMAMYILALSSWGKAPLASNTGSGAFSFGVLEAHASSGSTFRQTINAGTLAVDIVDGSYVTVGSPVVTFGGTTFAFACNTSTGTFGTTSTEVLYVQNPDASDTGWNITLAANSTTDSWESAGTNMDFNEAGAGGCVDDGGTTDADSLSGKLTIDPESGGYVKVGACSGCAVTNVSVQSLAAFEEGTTDSVTLVEGASGSDDIGDWRITGITASQTIPPEQPAAGDYAIDMVLTINAI
jgi:hypothetical protein